MEIEQPAPSHRNWATFPSDTATRTVISSPQTGLSWWDWPDDVPAGTGVSASPLPVRSLACSRMICWYSCSRLMRGCP